MNQIIRETTGKHFEGLNWWQRKGFLLIFGGTFVYVYAGTFKHQCVDNGNPAGIQDFNKIRICWSLFGRVRSRLFGRLMETPVAPTLRPSVYTTFAKILGIDLSECRYPLESYKSLAHVFARTLKEHARPICCPNDSDVLVVPCDGEIVNLAEVDFNAERLEQLSSERESPTRSAQGLIGPVKGATFRVESFLGFDPRFNIRTNPVTQGDVKLPTTAAPSDVTEQLLTGSVQNEIDMGITKKGPKKRFVYAVIYLAPHNYHHFHAPCEFAIQVRRHMPGLVLPVFKRLAKRLNDLFSVNERVVLSGRWKYGQLHYAAVAAYNVGHIRLKYEPDFKTNCHRVGLYPTGRVMSSLSYMDPEYDQEFIRPTVRESSDIPSLKAHWVEKGERIGEFRLGSTVVLIFEVPQTFQWDVSIGEKVRMGQPLGRVMNKHSS